MTGLTVTTTTNSAVLKWNAAEGVTGYYVYYRKPGDSVWKKASTTKLTHTFTGLTADTKYEFAAKGYAVIDRDEAKDMAERMEIMRKALLCDTFVMSSNAISEDGQLFNIDGNGNRVAAMCFGPKSVVVIAGMNKVAKTYEDAVTRARTYAAPMRAQSFPGIQTPCMVNGSCADCTSPDSVCAYMVTTRVSRPAGKVKVILVGEDLGF
mgnify:CR=1 FL=1